MLLTPAQIKPKSFESRRNSFFFTRGGCASCLRACLGARLLPQSYQYPNLSEGADRVGGQLRGDKECPFSDVTKSDRVWRKVPESDARSVECSFSDVTESDRVWRKVPESDARSVECSFSDVTESDRVWRKVLESDARSVCLYVLRGWRFKFLLPSWCLGVVIHAWFPLLRLNTF